MSDRKIIPFCPDLQLDWSLKRVEFHHLHEVKVVVGSGQRDARPDTMGRDVSDVLAYPEIYTKLVEAEFLFKKCLLFKVVDEIAASTVDRNEAEGEGRTFVRFLSSELLSHYKGVPALQGSLFHYRLVFQDEILDFVCTETPVIKKYP